MPSEPTIDAELEVAFVSGQGRPTWPELIAGFTAASEAIATRPGVLLDLPYGPQVLWPDHCVQATAGAALHADLVLPTAQLIIRKGWHAGVDSYSAFREADRRTGTGLAGYLREQGIEAVDVVGLATDFCVAWTALDAVAAGFRARVIEDACRGIDLGGSLAKAWTDLAAAGVGRASSAAVL